MEMQKLAGVYLKQKQLKNKCVLMNKDKYIDPKIKSMLVDLGFCILKR